MAPKLTLSYFPMWGRGEPIRLTCVVGKVPFTNKVLSGPDFKEVKESLPFGQLPVLDIEEEGKEKYTLPQTISILRYVGKLGGLYPSDPVEAAKVDSVIQTIDDMNEPLFVGAVRSFIREAEEFSEDEKKEIRLRIVAKHFPKHLSRLDSLVKDGNFVGGTTTIADVYFFTVHNMISSGVMDHIPTDLIDAYPGLAAVVKKVKELPEVKAWYEKYQKPYSTFDYTP